MERLPPELLTEILCRLRVNLLLRLRCVSKFFRNLIDSPNFINEHLKRSMDTRTHRLLILHEQNFIDSHRDFYYPEDIYVMNFDDGLQQAKKLNHPYPSKIRTTIAGSCNGLLLLVTYDEQYLHQRLVLWNPSTRRCKKLPFWSVHCEFGLGYDSASDDYKVVRISRYPKPNQVSVYSLRFNSWRRLQDLSTEYNVSRASMGCFANGALHWLFIKDMEYIIIAFDLATETFHRVKLVKSSENSTTNLSGLHVLEGSLGISLTTNDVTKMEQFELYVKENHGIGFTSSKSKYSFIQGPCHKKVKALAYSSKGNKVLLHDIDDMKIIWYDLHKTKGEIVEIDGTHSQNFYTIVCWESLVSPGDDSEYDGALHRQN